MSEGTRVPEPADGTASQGTGPQRADAEGALAADNSASSGSAHPGGAARTWPRRAERRRQLVRVALIDRSLELLPIFRLSDSADTTPIAFHTADGGRWRVLPAAGDRLPGTFDQDVYIELLRRFHDAGLPADGVITFTLHNFLRSLGRRADGRSYEQMRAALSRLERTVLESDAAYFNFSSATPVRDSFTLLSSVSILRKRESDQHQLGLFSAISAAEPGEARVVIAPTVRGNLVAGHTVNLDIATWLSLHSPVARRLFRILLVMGAERGGGSWKLPVSALAQILPLTQRFPSHLQRVLLPAHEMLIAAGVLQGAMFGQEADGWYVQYQLAEPFGEQLLGGRRGRDLA